MRKYYLLLIIFFYSSLISASDLEIIDLHNKSLDQFLLEENGKDNIVESQIEENISNNQNTGNLNDSSLEQSSSIEDVNIQDSIEKKSNQNQVILLSNLWEKTNGDNFNFILNNITNIKSKVLKNELLNILNVDSLPPTNLVKIDFENLIIRSLIGLGERKRAYDIIKSLSDSENIDYDLFYKIFELNYLLSTYALSEACELRNDFEDFQINNQKNFFLKVDIFCLLLQEKFDEANLLNSLLQDSKNEQDKYFEYIFNILNKINNIEESALIESKINEQEIFLYSAMHREGNIPLDNRFLKIDPINLSMPIILSSASNIKLRIQAAHSAYGNGLLKNTNALAALYQMVDFSTEDLNNPIEFSNKISNDIEISMAFFYQLSNIQLLPITRLEALISFWKFAEKNGLELIAYRISQKNLDSIEPSNELAEFGAEVSKAYLLSSNFEMAEKWLIYGQNMSTDLVNQSKLQSTKLLYKLSTVESSEEFIDVLIKNLETQKNNKLEENNQDEIKNEILFTIFLILDSENINPFEFNKKINEVKLMPSAFIMNNIRDCIINEKYSELLLSIIVSLNGKNWSDLHFEHLRLILIGLNKYKDGEIINSIILEILEESKII